MRKYFSLGLASLLILAAEPGNAQDVGAAIEASPPATFLRALGDKLLPDSTPAVPASEPAVEYVPSESLDRGPARAEEVLSPRAKAVMAKRDAFGAPETPTICTNCAD